MYCASCGTAIATGRSYCTRCGATAVPQAPLESTPAANKQTEYLIMLVWAIVAVAVVGVGAPIGLMAVMKEVLHLQNELILGAAFLSFLPFLLAELVFIWLVLRSKSAGRDYAPVRGATTRELGDAPPAALSKPASSVTEHTTHNLEPARRTSHAE